MEMVEKESAKVLKKRYTTAVTDLLTTYEYNKSTNEDKVLTYHSTEECLDAVKNGDADRAYVTTYSANYYLNTRKYRQLECVTVPDSSISICAAMSSSCNSTLSSIIQKSVRAISKNERNDIIVQNSLGNQNMSLSALVDRMPVWSIIVLFIVFAGLIALLLGLLHTRKKSSEKMELIIKEDELTGLYTVYGFDLKAAEILKNDSSDEFTVLDMDVSNIREYNLMYGFDEGDELLKYLSDYIKKSTRKNEIACRVNAGHFVMLVRNNIDGVISGLVTKFTMPAPKGKSFPVSLIYGICGVDDRNEDITLIRDNAEAAKNLCRKHAGRTYEVFSKEVDEYYEKEDRLMNEADTALDSGEFIAYFQPKYDVITGEVNGAEALARWLRPDGTILMPGAFIPLMQERRMITRLDKRMLENTCAALKRMIDAGIRPVTISANFSRVDIYGEDIVSTITAIVDGYSLPHDLIEIELTETAFELDRDIAAEVMYKARAAGFGLALDDFGSGFSSFKMIRDISFDVIKLDKSLIDDVAVSDRARFLVEGIINIAEGLGMSTVAEGVETEEQMRVITEAVCDTVQGFYKSKPVTEEAFFDLLKS
jgi:EAL domain-containing protein (putative c-di-GMP-specific phosphodiesterase class I)/GGDEF domain-containing protein